MDLMVLVSQDWISFTPHKICLSLNMWEKAKEQFKVVGIGLHLDATTPTNLHHQFLFSLSFCCHRSIVRESLPLKWVFLALLDGHLTPLWDLFSLLIYIYIFIYICMKPCKAWSHQEVFCPFCIHGVHCFINSDHMIMSFFFKVHLFGT